MFYQRHKDHGYHFATSDAERLANELNGWETIAEEEFWSRGKAVKPKEKPKEPEAEEIPHDVLVELYEMKFGKKPHHKMKDATIKDRLDGDNN